MTSLTQGCYCHIKRGLRVTSPDLVGEWTVGFRARGEDEDWRWLIREGGTSVLVHQSRIQVKSDFCYKVER